MKMNKIAVIFIAMILCIAQSAFSAEKPKPQASGPISGTYQASCVIRIIADDTVFNSQMLQNISFILNSSGIGAAAAKDILGYDAKDISDDFVQRMVGVIGISPLPAPASPSNGSDHIYTFGLEINVLNGNDSGDPRPAAREFMQSLIDGLKKNLDKSFMEYGDRLNQQIKIAGEDANKAEKDFYGMQERLRILSGSRDLSRKTILADINSIQTRIEALEMDEADNEIYLKDLPKQIESLRQNTELKIANDDISREFSDMVAEAQKQMDSVQKLVETGNASAQDLANAREKLFKARIELAQRREELRASLGGNRIERLNEELTDRLSRSNRFDQLRAFLLNQRIKAEELLKKTDGYEVLSIKADIAKQSLRQALERLESLKQSANLMPPTITVMGN
jgi:hypothetical protein